MAGRADRQAVFPDRSRAAHSRATGAGITERVMMLGTREGREAADRGYRLALVWSQDTGLRLGDETIIDMLADVLMYAHEYGGDDPRDLVERALVHVTAEISGDDLTTPAEFIHDGDRWWHCDRPAWSGDDELTCSRCQHSMSWWDDDDEDTVSDGGRS